jgi:hypothetical protein
VFPSAHARVAYGWAGGIENRKWKCLINQMRRLVLSALLLSAFPLVSMGEVEGQWTYSVENGEATIKSSTATGAVAIPSELGGNPVRKVGHLATVFGAGNTSVS